MKRPEILAPAGDRESLEAAVRAGADAVYFGLGNFNARARATNFDIESLGETMSFLHANGVRGYVTLNTLLFDAEVDEMSRVIQRCEECLVDAVIVQDVGVAKLVRQISKTLAIHASTQMTCTDAASCEFAKGLGATRVILARELSIAEIATISKSTDIELEVFVHGALCVAYSGQCLTSEAIGGRSANRGACAQACRLPYELVVDGVKQELGEKAYLLSPEDLEASALVPDLMRAGVRSFKIEGRLKGPAYVAATVSLYKTAIEAAVRGDEAELSASRTRALQAFSRGSGTGFFRGVDHQKLVDGRTCDHRGLLLGTLSNISIARGRTWLHMKTSESIARGDGVLVEGSRAGDGEVGGRVWHVEVNGRDVDRAESGVQVQVWLGPDRAVRDDLLGRRIFRTSSPNLEKEASAISAPIALFLVVEGSMETPLRLVASSDRGHFADVETSLPLEEARGAGLDEKLLREKLSALAPFSLRQVDFRVKPGLFVPPSAIKEASRRLVLSLNASFANVEPGVRSEIASFDKPLPPPPPGLWVLCRNLDQARAAARANASGIILDFLELTGTGTAFRELSSMNDVSIFLAPPRIRKPGEEKIDQFLTSLGAKGMLVRTLGALHELSQQTLAESMYIGDFSLNVTHARAAREMLLRGLSAFTPAFDLDGAQLLALLDDRELAMRAEVVVHHHMPLFYMEHCIYAALLSKGSDHRTCGRPCDRHDARLMDRQGMTHPVIADVGCRNTVFHERAQSGAKLIPHLLSRGVSRFRIELTRETAEEVALLTETYRGLVAGETPAEVVWNKLNAEMGLGVVRGSLRVLS